MFCKSKPTFTNLDDLTQKIGPSEKDNDMQLTIKHSVPKRLLGEYICNSHNNCSFFCGFGPYERESIKIIAK
jgi:hypothetical protein